MTFEAENELEAALMRAPTDAAARPELYKLLLDSNLFVIGKTDVPALEEEPFTLPAGAHLQLASVTHNDRNYHLLFTSLTRLRTYVKTSADYLRMNGRALFECTCGAAFWLNPGSDFGKQLLPQEIDALLNPAAPRTMTVDRPTQVLIGQPAVYPHELVNALKVAFAKTPNVLRAYLVQIAFPDQAQAPHPLIGVETIGEWQPISAEIGRVAHAVAPGTVLDVVQIDRTAARTALNDALLKTEPFYVAARRE